MRPRSLFVLSFALFLSVLSFGRSKPTSDPTALALAAQSMAALTNGTTINDVTLNGTATYTAGDDGQTGSATFLALGYGESRMDISLDGGARTEIRDASSGSPAGKWATSTGATDFFAFHNCMTDAVWFFPGLTSLAVQQNTVLVYVGQETRNGAAVQHIQAYTYSAESLGVDTTTLSTEDVYLDAISSLPVAVTFKTHPDGDAGQDIPVEINFFNYQAVNGVLVPMHTQKYLNGTLLIDITIASAAFNSGVSLSNFSLN